MALSTLSESLNIIGQSRNAYANLLKEYYADMWDLHVHTEVMIMSIIGRKKGVMGGRRVVAAVVDSLPQSAGITSNEGVHMPTPTTGTYQNPEVLSRGMFSRLRWTVESELAARAGQKAAWARPRKIDVEHARKQLDLNLARKAYLAYADILGVVDSHTVTGGRSVITLENRNDRTSSGSAFWYFGNFFFRVRQGLGIIDVSAGGTVLGAPWANVESSTQEFFVSAKGGTDAAPTISIGDATGAAVNLTAWTGTAITPAAGDLLIPHANRRSAISAGNAAVGDFSSFNGIGNICTDSSIYGYLFAIDKTTSPTFNGRYMANGGLQRPFEEKLVMLFVDRIHDDGTGNEPDCLVQNRAVRREVVREHDGDRRYAPIIGKSGFGQLVAHVGDVELPYKSDWNCPPGMIIGLNKDSWGWCSLADQQPVDQSMERWVADYAQHEILWHKHGNLYNTRPYDNGILDDIDFDVYALL